MPERETLIDVMRGRAITVSDLRVAKARDERFVMLTAYDHASATLLDEVGVPVILVGDTLGMVVLGRGSTVPVDLDEMVHHARAVVRGAPRSLVVGDLPFGSYQDGPSAALRSATRMMQEGGVGLVKVEGGGPMIDVARHLVAAGIPVMGHLGLTPQAVNLLGGFKVQARQEGEAQRLVEDAMGLVEAGVSAIVLECIPVDVGREVTQAVAVPTIGIGAGPHTDAQVLVWHDLLGLTRGRLPRFVKQYADLHGTISEAVGAFQRDVATGVFPGPEHTY